VNGQQIQTHVLAPEAFAVAVLMDPLTMPGSPEPVSPDVWCQGADPSSKVEDAGVATMLTEPAAAHIV
jgi:hypothetical protein